MNKYNFSERMKAIAGFVIKDRPVADIGTDHGFVPIDLIANETVPFAVMTDINQGPLDKALGNLNRVGILPQYYDLRLGNGLEPVKPAEVDTVIIAGMGAETIIDILSEDIDKSKSYKRLVLQPRKRCFLLRKWLLENNFTVNHEVLVKEEPKICEIISAEPASDAYPAVCDDIYLPSRIRADELFPEYLDIYIHKNQVVIDNLKNSEAAVDLITPWQNRLNIALELKEKLQKGII